MKPFAHSKLQGEWVEVLFIAECLRRGFICAKPYGDSAAYDFIIESGRKRLSRVQVKSVSVRPANGIYHVATMRSVASNKKPYRAGDFDFLAAYIIPRGLWYIIPAREVFDIKMISLCPAPLGPRPRRRRLEKYRQAWRLLRG